MSILPLVCAPALFAQRYAFELYGAAHGLSNPGIHSLSPAPHGGLWLATVNGLYSFDGYRAERYASGQGLPSENVLSVIQDSSGRTWAGTWKGLAWTTGRGHFVAARAALLRRPIPVQGLALAPSGRIYAATREGLALLSDPTSGGDVRFSFVPRHAAAQDANVTSVLAAPNGDVWYGCGRSICSLSGGAVRMWGPAQGVPDLGFDRYQALRLDSRGVLWARSTSRLLYLPAGATRFLSVPATQVPPCRDAYPTLGVDEDTLIVPTPRGLYLHRDGAWRTVDEANGLPFESTSSALVDPSGAIWIGSAVSRGLARWPAYRSWSSYQRSEGLHGRMVLEVVSSPGNRIWALTSLGLVRGEPAVAGWRWTPESIPGVSLVSALEADPDGSLWIADSSNRIFRYNPTTRASVSFGAAPQRPQTIRVSRAGTLIVLTQDSLSLLFPGHPRPTLISAPANIQIFDAHSLAEDSTGAVWIGTHLGLLRYHNGAWLQFGTSNSALPSQQISSIATGPDGWLYFGYYGQWLVSRARLTAGRLSVEPVPLPDSGPAQIRHLSFDSQRRLWVLTDRGILLRQDNRWHSFRAGSGPISEELLGAFLEFPRLQFWFGTANGLLHFQPGATLPPPSLPRVATALLDGLPISVPVSSNPRWRSSNVVLQLSASPFDPSSTFRYRIPGSTDAWTDLPSSDLRLPALPSGRHTLELALSSGLTQSKSIRLDFLIDPPLPSSVLYTLAAAAALLLAATFYWRFRLRQTAAQQALLEAAVNDRTHELQDANRRLSAEIEERELAAREKDRLEARLRHGEKLEAVGRLAGGIAHDFNNLLTVINGYAQIVAARLPADHPSHSQVQAILQAGQRAADLTGKLLTFSRRQIVEVRPVQLSLLLRETQSILARLLGEHITLAFQEAPEDLWVLADASQLHQVVLNLAANARDAMPAGGTLSVSLSAANLADRPPSAVGSFAPGPYAAIAFSDSGPGFGPDVATRLFEPFFSTKGAQGNGLGLASSLGIVKQFHGFLTAQSEPGRGATFTVCLPAIPAPDRLPFSAQASAPADPTSAIRILVVEDQAEVRTLVHEILSAHGYLVNTAADPTEALQAVRSGLAHPDIVLTDVIMPGMTGPQMVDQLRRFHPALRVVFMSGYTDAELSPHGISRQHTAFLPKPFSHERLLTEIQRILP